MTVKIVKIIKGSSGVKNSLSSTVDGKEPFMSWSSANQSKPSSVSEAVPSFSIGENKFRIKVG